MSIRTMYRNASRFVDWWTNDDDPLLRPVWRVLTWTVLVMLIVDAVALLVTGMVWTWRHL